MPIHNGDFLRGDVHQARIGAIRHGVPVVTTQGVWELKVRHTGFFITRFRGLYGAPRFGIYVRRPGSHGVLLGRDKFTGFAINHIEKAVFGRLHNDFTHPSIELHVG